MKNAKSHLAFGPCILPLLVGLAAAPPAQAQTFRVLHSFDGTDGANPYARLVMDGTGDLFGTTTGGGAFNAGTVFRVNDSGEETVLYDFTGGTDGKKPLADLIRDTTGNLYGTTEEGGDLACSSGSGCGTVFKLDTTNTETVLHSFTGPPDGFEPFAGLVRDAAGNLYGDAGGGDFSDGAVFEVSTSGAERVLFSFNYQAGDGAGPTARLVRDGAGNLYGVTESGGASNDGTVFRLDKTGKETVLHSFAGGVDGMYPFGALIMDATGNLYGTTIEGGLIGRTSKFCRPYGCGTLFKLDSTGKETVLYRFAGSADGKAPYADLIMDSAGNLYGTTSQGGIPSCTIAGSAGCGTVFKLDVASRTETVLHSFGGVEGASPYAGLVMDAAGNLYGTTYYGRDKACRGGCGVVFEVVATVGAFPTGGFSGLQKPRP